MLALKLYATGPLCSCFWNSAFALRCFFRALLTSTVNTSGIFLMPDEEGSTMNTRTTLLAVLTAALALPALADTTAPVTREQVKAEYIRALKAGELDFAREFVTPVSRPS